MPVFAYTAKAADGKVLSATAEAISPMELRQRLTQQGMTVKDVKVAKAAPAKAKAGAAKGGGFMDRFSRVKLTDLSLFCRQFSTMIDAGVSLVRCLDVLSDQSQSAKLRRIINDMRSEVEAGNTLRRRWQNTRPFSTTSSSV
jgi:type IV pilus assembly protein PilC